MNIDIHVDGASMAVALEGRLDTLTAPELQKALEEYKLAGVSEIVVDLGKLEYISSAGLRVLLQAHRSMMTGGVMRIVNANEITKKVFRVTGFESIFTIE